MHHQRVATMLSATSLPHKVQTQLVAPQPAQRKVAPNLQLARRRAELSPHSAHLAAALCKARQSYTPNNTKLDRLSQAAKPWLLDLLGQKTMTQAETLQLRQRLSM